MDVSLRKMKKRTVLLILAAVILGLAILAIVFGKPLLELFSSKENIQSAVQSAGPLGPLVLIALQALQVLVAPIPGQVTSFASGYLFGAVWGTVYSMIGVTIGFTLVFVLARKLGRPFVEYFVDQKTLKKFDYLAESQGVFIFFLIFLLPFFPDDMICYIAGLTKIPIRTLVIISIIARIPSSIVFALAGQNVADNNIRLVIQLTAVGLVLSGLVWLQRDKLESLVKRFSTEKPDK